MYFNPSNIDINKYNAVVFSGGPASVTDPDAPKFDSDWLKINKPILGICYGMQLISYLFGGTLSKGESREYGRASLKILKDNLIFKGLDKNKAFEVLMSHGDHVENLPRDFEAIASSESLPNEIIHRQPFLGPGLAVRIIGEITKERLNVLREADSIFLEEIKKENLYNGIWQSFVVLLPVQSVGVMGDTRTYEQTAALRAVYSQDGMTADWCYLPQELLSRTSNRIINEVKGINRVVLDISSKPPSTIEWE